VSGEQANDLGAQPAGAAGHENSRLALMRLLLHRDLLGARAPV
jgi:hypothetical protein